MRLRVGNVLSRLYFLRLMISLFVQLGLARAEFDKVNYLAQLQEEVAGLFPTEEGIKTLDEILMFSP